MARLTKGGRKKIEIKRIVNERERAVTMSKRHNGLFKKACELATLCGVHIAIIFFTIGGKSLSFGSPSICSVLKKFMKTNEVEEQRESYITQLTNSAKESSLQELNNHYNEISEKLINEKKRGQVLEETLKGSFGGKMSEECISGLVTEKPVELKFRVIELQKILKDLGALFCGLERRCLLVAEECIVTGTKKMKFSKWPEKRETKRKPWERRLWLRIRPDKLSVFPNASWVREVPLDEEAMLVEFGVEGKQMVFCLKCSGTNGVRLSCIIVKSSVPARKMCHQLQRSTHNVQPMSVVYATLDTAIKHWSSDMLHKLEADMFQKVYVGDAAGDDRDVFEEVYDEDMDEDIGWEDDLFEDDGSDGVPEDAEAMKKKAAAFLKRAGELIEMGVKVIDKGIEDNPDDHGFLELKELRDQLFVPRKFSPDVNEDEEACEQCFTPEKGVNKKGSGAADECVFPFTQVALAMLDELCREWSRNHQQIPTRLNFEDDEGFDLNVTQPPATQGKVVVDDLEADQVLLESLRDYVSQDPADVGGFMTPDHPISVGAHESNTSNRLSRFGRESMGSKSKEIVPVYPNPMPLNVLVPKVERARAQRKRLLPEVLRSPYMTREVSVRSKTTVTRLFCHTSMLTSDMVNWDYHRALQKFVENMDYVLNRSEYDTLDYVQLVFFPVIKGHHFFVDNLLLPNTTDAERFDWFILLLISLFEDYLLHKNNPNYDRMTHAGKEVIQLGCRTTNNFVDCGVFTMRHMETYKGNGADLCCLSKEGKDQTKELKGLRVNDIDKEVHRFKNVPDEEKKRLRRAAFETIKLRVSAKFEVARPVNTKGGNCRTWREPKRYIAMMLANKPTRKCGYCGKYAYHDARNCPERKKIERHDVYQVVLKGMDVYGDELLY
ncbi:transcription factor, MADS-box [Artemisia annua]|uniref:Transcription factor, MADS-box n=1 Tax=Artemisia annua TaxID=35608 RepID=A0A2U1PMU3_ARTAN|nr:transcription factor, MADS-box [Artemisia annua]